MSFLGWSTAVRRAGIDDAIDAAAVHMGAGIWGVISVSLLLHEFDNYASCDNCKQVPIFSFEDSIFYDDSKSAWRTLGWAFVSHSF